MNDIEERAEEYGRQWGGTSYRHFAEECFLAGAKEQRAIDKACGWHKASEELPTRFGDYLVVIKSQQFGRRCALKCWFGYPKDPFGDNPSKEWALEDDEIVTHWMEIPGIKEERK